MSQTPLRLLLGLALIAPGVAADDPAEPEAAPERLGMSPAVVCRDIKGYEDFVPLDEPAVTEHEKLLIYYKPINYGVAELKGGKFRVHLTQEARIRPRGKKTVIWKKADLLTYNVKSDRRPGWVFLRNTIALKGLKPGEYDLDIILKDRVAGDATATQVVAFRVKPSPVESAARRPQQRRQAPIMPLDLTPAESGFPMPEIPDFEPPDFP